MSESKRIQWTFPDKYVKQLDHSREQRTAVIIERARKVLEIESKAIYNLIGRLDTAFVQAVDIISKCQGKVIVTGIGKSGLIGKKIASTLASTGTPAIFLHTAEASHGDLGMLSRGDVVVGVSNSGETEELIRILPVIKRLGAKLIGLTGNVRSTFAQRCDIVLDVSVKEEACPMGIVPTASTTATLAMGDALAVSLLEERGFRENDFAFLHPAGSLNRKLLLTVEDLMHVKNELPTIKEDTSFKELVLEISSKKLGVTAVLNWTGRVSGIITDGDLRRAMERSDNPMEFKAREIMNHNPKMIEKQELAAKALQIMENYSITSLLVTDQDNFLIGIIHLHDLLKAGII